MRFVQRSFLFCFRPFMRSRLRVVRSGEVRDVEPTRPLVLVANHVSWWDGFLLLDLARRARPKSRMLTVMLESELRRVPLLRALGGIGLTPGALGPLRALLDRLRSFWSSEPSGMLAVFPQGKIWPTGRRPLGFRPGLRRFVTDAVPCTILPVGLHVEPLNHLAPTAFVRVGPPIPVDQASSFDLARVEAAVADCLDHTMTRLVTLGEEAGP